MSYYHQNQVNPNNLSTMSFEKNIRGTKFGIRITFFFNCTYNKWSCFNCIKFEFGDRLHLNYLFCYMILGEMKLHNIQIFEQDYMTEIHYKFCCFFHLLFNKCYVLWEVMTVNMFHNLSNI